MSGDLTIRPARLCGTIAAPPSKSLAHRALIAASLARGESRIGNLELSEDIRATAGAVRALGARVEFAGTPGGRLEAAVQGIEGRAERPVIDCGESGSTLRFMLPVALAAAGRAVFTGAGRLGQRPLGPYFDIFDAHGVLYELCGGGFPLTVRGRLAPGRFIVPGGVSSQFITGLLLAAPLLAGESEIAVEGELESLPYVDLTVHVLGQFGVAVEEPEHGRLYRVAPQEYGPREFRVEGDWSQAAFLLLMGLAGGQVSVSGLDAGSQQGDRAIEALLRSMGGSLTWEGGALTARQSSLTGICADVSQCPDLAPALAAAMAVAGGESRITGGKRLRDKESDRLKTIVACLGALGAAVAETADGLVIHGRPALSGGVAQSFNDHRIAMMAAAVSPACSGPVRLYGPEAVAKSWPGFWQEFKGVGGEFDGQPLG